jgi:exonuclease SbcD
MRLLHTSDWHLGRVLYDYSLLEDQRQTLAQVIQCCRAGGYDALVVAGDLFERSLPSAAAVRLWSGFQRGPRAACPDLPLLVIAGIDLDALFIDEGFGSLDSGALDSAMQVLDEPVQGRMVASSATWTG